jgi:hypothetical protein
MLPRYETALLLRPQVRAQRSVQVSHRVSIGLLQPDNRELSLLRQHLARTSA